MAASHSSRIINALLLTNCGVPRFKMVIGPIDSEGAYFPPEQVPSVVTDFAEWNLPVIPIVALPYFYLLGGPDHPNFSWLVVLLGIFGIGVWNYVGRFLNDLCAGSARMRKIGFYDGLAFMLIIFSSCLVLADADVTSFALSTSESSVRIVAICWLMVGCISLIFRLMWQSKGRQTRSHI